MWFLFLMFFMVFIFLGMASWETILIVACFTFLFIVPLLCIIKTRHKYFTSHKKGAISS